MTKILLVEDNEMNQDMLTRRLLRRGYKVVCAMDGQAGVDMAYSETPDLILMDMSLPIMDGWAATRRLKADVQTRSIPIIALTAHAMVGDRQKSMDAGCDDYDTKPVELARLLSKIETLLATGVVANTSVVAEIIGAVSVPAQVAIPLPPLSPSATIRAVDPIAATILIIDDNEMNRDMLGRRLERAGYKTILAEGGRQGLELISQREGYCWGKRSATANAQQPIDLVLLDIMMPDFNGIETLQAIRLKYTMAQLPVIMATAKDRSEDMLQAFELGANDYVVKPIDLPVVLARIQSQLRLIQSASQPQNFPGIQPELQTEIQPVIKSVLNLKTDILEPTIIKSAPIESGSKLFLERYKISQVLVRGEFHSIYLAQDTNQVQQPTCLVHQLEFNHEHPSLNLAGICEFDREVAVFKQISQHCSIVKILDALQQEQQLLTIQEYIGTDLLSNKLKLGRSAGIATTLTTVVEMLEILQPLHQNQLIHQHLSPECFAYNSSKKLTLIDLGITSRILAKNYRSTTIDDRNIYRMSEQWQQTSAASCDIYAVGMIAVHSLTGTSPDQISIDPGTGEINWRDLVIVAESFVNIINKMICKNPDHRYASIDHILNDLYQLPMVSVLLQRARVLS